MQLTERKERNGYYRREHSSDGEQNADAAAGNGYHAPGSKRQRTDTAGAAADRPPQNGNMKQHGVGEGHPVDPVVEGAQQPVGGDELQ